MKKTHLGIMLGACAGIVDVIPMLLQKLTWDADLSAFSLWVVSGFLIAASNLKIKGFLKGIAVSLLVLLPAAVLIGWKEPASLVPIIIMTVGLGAALGYLIGKFGK